MSARGRDLGAGMGAGGGGSGGIGGRAQGGGYRVVAGLTLYKVQMNIYLLDFHKREGDQFTFMVSRCMPAIALLPPLAAFVGILNVVCL